MHTRILQLSLDLLHIRPHLLWRPRLRRPEFRQQEHRPTLKPGIPMLLINPTGLLQLLILRPRPTRRLNHRLLNIHKPRRADLLSHRLPNIQRPTSLLPTLDKLVAPFGEQHVGLDGAVVGHDAHVALDVLNVPAWFERVVAFAVHVFPFGFREGAEQQAQVDEVELLWPGPGVEHVFDFELAVWRHEGCWWRV